MSKPTFKRITTVVVAIECETVGSATPEEIGYALIGRVELPDRFYHYVNETTIKPQSIGLMDVHEGVPLEAEEHEKT